MQDLTERQQEIWAYLLGYYEDNTWMPSRREIAERFGFQVNAAQKHLQALERKGYIKLYPTARGIKINEN